MCVDERFVGYDVNICYFWQIIVLLASFVLTLENVCDIQYVQRTCNMTLLKTRPKRLGSMSPDGCLLIQLEVHLFIMPTRKQFQLPKAVPQKSSSKTGKCHQWFKKFSRILFKAAQPFSHTYDKFFYSEVLQSFESFD